jgi:uncharacterized RDD family membrane protein YckC
MSATPPAPPTADGPAAFTPWTLPPEQVALQPTPGVWRRLACFLYEGVLLFGVVVITALAYGVVMQQRHAQEGRLGLQVTMFVVLGLYFTWFWARRGQTLAMQTWHIRVIRRDGQGLAWPRALSRYLLAWLWFLPALAILHFQGIEGAGASFGVLLAGVVAYAALARLHPDRQYWHDVVCGTRLITWRPPPRPRKPGAEPPARASDLS